MVKGPTRAELLACADRTVDDVVAPGLRILFCGINPGLYTAWAGHHFARPGNRFWPALHRAGLTPTLLRPQDEQDLLALGLGITNLAPRATARADELTRAELLAGRAALVAKVHALAPRVLAVLGLSAYRVAFDRPRAVIGPQDGPADSIGRTRLWVLPNPSGLNAHYQLGELAELLRALATAASPSATAR